MIKPLTQRNGIDNRTKNNENLRMFCSGENKVMNKSIKEANITINIYAEKRFDTGEFPMLKPLLMRRPMESETM